MASGDPPEREHSKLDELFPTPPVESIQSLEGRRNARTGALDVLIVRGTRSISPHDQIARELFDRKKAFGSQARSTTGAIMGLAAFPIAAALFALTCAISANPAIALSVAIVAAAGYVLVLRRGSPFTNAVIALREGRCPDCGYDLSGHPDAIEIEDVSVGPERCPECGSPWPLVPPPTVTLRDIPSTLDP